MASQRVLILAFAGPLADAIWSDVRRWGDARAPVGTDESPEDWPDDIRDEIDAFVENIVTGAFTPPVLYRSEHVDCWSMGDVFADALGKSDPDYSRQLRTTNHEIIATWVTGVERLGSPRPGADEYGWLHSRVNEAIAAWSEFADDRLLILVRTILGGLWTDDEVAASLESIPEWWGADSREKAFDRGIPIVDEG
jgi:hypothetical protein